MAIKNNFFIFISLLFIISTDSCKTTSSTSGVPAKNLSTLQEAYLGAFKMGTAVNGAIVNGRDSLSQAIVIDHFNTTTPENIMKAALVNPEPGVFNWGPADEYVDFAKKHKMFIVGHTLVWHNQTPMWFFQDAKGNQKSPAETKERLKAHIELVAGRYANTELYYNDFNAWRPAKRDGIVRMVRMLQKEGIRIDGIGIQGHWGLNYPKNEYIEAAIDSFAALGVKVMITELDVDVLPLTKEGQIIGQGMSDRQFQLEEFKTFFDPYKNGLPKEIEQQLTDRYVELFKIFYAKKDKIDRVTLWGVADDMSWKNGYPIPGRTNYPLLWNRDRKPKPTLNAILNIPTKK
ncbi:MAG: endo-1,4-beta-xylanase [Saprospiraceae bacterium]|nr:endo-1,4-beta-xylanase [Saprospiraceae bacterium]